MILSMTGFAAVAAELPGLSVAVELRSVNHRYLDVTVKLPDELRTLETALRERLATALKRGKVECRVALARAAGASAAMAVDPKRVSALADAASEVRHLVPGAAPLSTAEILRWPGVLMEPTVGGRNPRGDRERDLSTARSRSSQRRVRVKGPSSLTYCSRAAPTSKRR